LRRACIDIGSNTTRLLVADCDGDGGLVEHRQHRAFTMLGRSIDASGAIPTAKLAEVLQAVAMQYALARELGAEQVRCVATAGVRRAANGATLVGLVRDVCEGLELEILSDAEEARLAFIGAAWGIGAEGEKGLGVVDAGGGSSELVVGDAPAHVRWWVSLPLGSGDVADRWLRSDPPTAAELAEALRRTQAIFADVRPPAEVRRMVAVGGSATSLRMLAGPMLDLERLDQLLETARRYSAAEFARSFGIDVQRARLLAGGLLILRVVSELVGAPLEIGRGGLREGLLLEMRQ
jgi:exopolyphosphatase / guanosine-5'-triphosphate,3'-diphosphate pyrophosphatase